MKSKAKNLCLICLMSVILGGFSVWAFLKPADKFSESERRMLASFPKFSADTVMSGKFAKDFESYVTDQFPMRETFRSAKAFFSLYALGRSDVGGVFVSDSHISKIEYPMSTSSIDYAARKFRRIYEKYLADSGAHVYLAVIPDKNSFVSKNVPKIDCEKFAEYLREKTDFMEYIDIFPFLSLDDYYRTDIHWREEKISDVASELAERMGTVLHAKFKKELVSNDFRGVYYGQLALSVRPDELYVQRSEFLDKCRVFDYESEREIPVYNMDKLNGYDFYEVFLSGPLSLITIENPNSTSEKELVLFRDSFGSSIAPLLAEGYSKTTLVDIRYLSSELLSSFISFDNTDVLFLYCTTVLNNSIAFK